MNAGGFPSGVLTHDPTATSLVPISYPAIVGEVQAFMGIYGESN
jgi:hypothetical protein